MIFKPENSEFSVSKMAIILDKGIDERVQLVYWNSDGEYYTNRAVLERDLASIGFNGPEVWAGIGAEK